MNVDAEITVDGARTTVRSLDDSAMVATPKSFFTIASYAPLVLQSLLVRYWEAHGRPTRIALLPGDSTAWVSVEARGATRIAGLALRRYSFDGVAWGREILYLDTASRFVAIVTRPNLLPLEGVREDLAAAHPSLLDSIRVDAARAQLTAATSIPPMATGSFAFVGARIIDDARTDRRRLDHRRRRTNHRRRAASERRDSTGRSHDRRARQNDHSRPVGHARPCPRCPTKATFKEDSYTRHFIRGPMISSARP